MKRMVLAVILCLGSYWEVELHAGQVTGYVSDEAGKPQSGILVSDGISIVATDLKGYYKLDLHDKQPFLFIHRPDGQQGQPWYIRRPKSGEQYSFVLKARHTAAKRSFLQISDTETPNMSWTEVLHGYSPDFLMHTGDLCRSDGIPAHAKALTMEALGYPVYFAVGNHDIVKPWDNGKTYADFLPPYYYSFDWGPYLVVVAPMWGGDAPLPYELADFGDWLRQLLTVAPKNKPMLVFCHALYNPNSYEFPGHNGKIADVYSRLAGWFFGHYHQNFVLPLKNGASAFGVAPAEMGGIAHSPPSTREVWLDEKNQLRSRLHWNATKNDLYLTCPGPLGRWQKDNHEYCSVTGWYRGNPIEKITAVIESGNQKKQVPLHYVGGSWTGEIPQKQKPDQTITLIATLRNGNTTQRQFTSLVPNRSLRLKWLATMDSESFLTAPIAGAGKIFTASTDDHEGKKGAVYAWDGKNGKLVWKYHTRASVGNTMAYKNGLVLAQDTLGNVYAIRAANGQKSWSDLNPELSSVPTTNGLYVKGNTLYAGYSTRLSAYDVSTGKLLWRNREWAMSETCVSTIRAEGNCLIAAGNWYGLYGFNAADGKQLWKDSANWMAFQSAAVLFHDGKIYAKGERVVQIIDPATGKVLLSRETPGSLQCASAPVIVGNTLVIGGMFAVYGLDVNTLAEKWRFVGDTAILDTAPYASFGKPLESTPVLWNGLLWFGMNDGNLYALDPASGKLKEKYTIGAPILASVLASGKQLYLVDFCGRVFCFEKE